MLGEAEAKGIEAGTRITNTELNITMIEVRALAAKEALCEANNQASAMKEEALVAEVLAAKAIMEMIEAFKVGEEYHLEVLEASRDAFQ